jgi:hypothetical protein
MKEAQKEKDKTKRKELKIINMTKCGATLS